MTTADLASPTATDLFAACARDLSLRTGLRIGGAAPPSRTGERFEVVDPTTEGVLAEVANGTPEDAVDAVTAAAEAAGPWAATTPRFRSDVLRRAFELTLERRAALATLISLENGKSLADSQAEVTYAAEFFRWYSEEAVRTEGEFGTAPGGGVRTIVTHRPVGVALLVTPWNFPAAMAARKIGPALAAGCAVVLKPASETPLTALAFADILHDAGAAPGTVNVVPGRAAADLVAACLEDPRVRKLSFTGSTPVGRHLLRQAAGRVVNASMELGGNAPFVVLPGSDVDAAVEGALVAKFRNTGQACTAANRFYLHADVHDSFVEKFTRKVATLVAGSPTDTATDLGPLVSRRAHDGVTRLVDDAVRSGAHIAFRGSVPETGFFYPATVLTDVKPDAELLDEEIFGPVAPIVRWTDENDLVSWVNHTEMGLAAYVYGPDAGTALRFAERVDAGMVGINRGLVSEPSAPFGGTKQSGLGREGARDGLREYQETQYYSVAWGR
ncbi:NAD-dependent succinate-semialdehyde dehydrogenase [Streptomyces canus]|uniref:NAD-dependent succinate-semialdehyde dehydrogenase n=1 Tax=Streptomyces canus TaxID=58343 RepID=UPI002E3352FF|nr:NAD-dependent succinate-semialdehyde dehydrogenase [Streptomyces canus]